MGLERSWKVITERVGLEGSWKVITEWVRLEGSWKVITERVLLKRSWKVTTERVELKGPGTSLGDGRRRAAPRGTAPPLRHDASHWRAPTGSPAPRACAVGSAARRSDRAVPGGAVRAQVGAGRGLWGGYGVAMGSVGWIWGLWLWGMWGGYGADMGSVGSLWGLWLWGLWVWGLWGGYGADMGSVG